MKSKFSSKVIADGRSWYVDLVTYGMNKTVFGPFKTRDDARFIKKVLALAIEEANERVEI